MNSTTRDQLNESMYQSLTVKASENEYDRVNQKPSGGSLTIAMSDVYTDIKDTILPTQQTEYDMIRETHPVFMPRQEESVTTDNLLYASHSQAMRHPTLKVDHHQCQISPVAESYFTVQESHRCKCSVDAILCVLSLLTILLSSVTIALVLLLHFGVITANVATTSPVAVAPVAMTSTNDITPTSTGQLFSSLSVVSSTLLVAPSPTHISTLPCDCPVPAVSIDVDEISDSIYRISQAITQFRYSENMSVSDTVQQLSEYLSQIKAINDSLQQLRPQSNQPREPLLTGLNLTANLKINISEGCFTQKETACIHDPENSGLPYCEPPTVPFLQNDKVMVDFSCDLSPVDNVTFSYNDATAIEVMGSVSSDDSNSFESLLSSSFRCHCFPDININNRRTNCGFYVRRCPYRRDTVTAATIDVPV